MKRHVQDNPTNQEMPSGSGSGSLAVPGPYTLLSNKLKQATSAPL